jgi:hypothetical protein
VAAPALGVVVYVLRLQLVAVAWLVWFLDGVQLLGLGVIGWQ